MQGRQNGQYADHLLSGNGFRNVLSNVEGSNNHSLIFFQKILGVGAESVS
jgi:hypothetical protein